MTDLESLYDAYPLAFGIIEIVGLAFLLLIASETIWDFVTKRRAGWRETAANFFISLVGLVTDRFVYGLVFAGGLVLVGTIAPFKLPMTWWSWILALIAVDFTYYWMHRLEHEIRILWAHHSTHHSSPEFNLTTSLRLSWVEGLIEWVFFIPMVLIGFDAIQIVASYFIMGLYQIWIHTEKIGKLGWLEGIVNTPSVHRVHHGSNAKYIDKNYGGILIIWDRLFGTYQRETEKVVYGIVPQLGTSNPIAINFREYADIARDVAKAGSAREAAARVFNPPGWKPDE